MSSSRALAHQERPVQVKRFGRLAKGLLLSAATLMTFATVTLLALDRLYRPDAFVINQLKIIGKFSNTTPSDVQAVIFAEPLGNFFSIELDDIKHRVMAMPWIQSADVRRVWPHTLSVTVQEHRPIMRWHSFLNTNDQAGPRPLEQWISANGDIISLDTPLNLQSPMSLKGTERDARQLLTQSIAWQKQLANSGIRVVQVQLTASQSWHLILSSTEGDEFELLLGRENVEQRLDRFQTLFDQQFKESDQRLVRADARYPDGLAIKATTVEPERVEQTEPDSVDAQSMGQNDVKMIKVMNEIAGYQHKDVHVSGRC